MMTEDIFFRVIKYVEKHHMITAGDRLVAGISGGADSICLLFMLLKYQEKLPFTWTAVHVNHGLRGEEAARDQAYVEALCRKYGIPCRVFSEDVSKFAKEQDLTLEEAGRVVRRDCFLRVIRENHADKVVLAHHQNDNAETLLMNLARGTGLGGLGGMKPVNGIFIRPLLCLKRPEIEAWLRHQQIEWCTDSTNSSDHYTRNRIRNHIIPMLEEMVNPKAVVHLQEMMTQMQCLKDYVDLQTEAAWEICVCQEEDGGILLCQSEWEKLHPYLQAELLRRCLVCAAGREKDISQNHIEALGELFDRQTGRKISLPYNVTAWRTYDGVRLRKKQCAEPENLAETEKMSEKLIIPGETQISWAKRWINCTILEKKPDFSADHLPQSPYTKWFDYDIIKGGLTVRTRQKGDYLVIDEKGNRQKLKAWFINEKIPAAKRDQILLIACGSEIIWIPGYRRGNSHLIKNTTKTILQIQMNGGEQNGGDNKSLD